ncbi:9491_t:CDS:2 [Funneliformis mosseae]|uniref:9491_t:CDS:1 n=1 Tax=Funneliformis mosseae TaxID=27381 RepID=A0A9N8ZGZ8_FUNMO|nr:9491_t:CDS:2 [Funneliformis mosseae]
MKTISFFTGYIALPNEPIPSNMLLYREVGLVSSDLIPGHMSPIKWTCSPAPEIIIKYDPGLYPKDLVPELTLFLI